MPESGNAGMDCSCDVTRVVVRGGRERSAYRKITPLARLCRHEGVPILAARKFNLEIRFLSPDLVNVRLGAPSVDDGSQHATRTTPAPLATTPSPALGGVHQPAQAGQEHLSADAIIAAKNAKEHDMTHGTLGALQTKPATSPATTGTIPLAQQ
jgi:hypothetical protein